MRVSRAGVLVVLFAAGCFQGGKSGADGSDSTGKGSPGLTYAVAVSRPVGGTIRSADGKIDCGPTGSSSNLCGPVTYAWADKAALSATPAPNYFFISWAGDCSDTGACTFDMVATPGADKWVVAVFNALGQIGHGDFASPAKHGPAFFSYAAGVQTAPKCQTCHGLDYKGLSIAPSCVGCHENAGWTGGLSNCTFCHGTRTPAGTTNPALIAPPDDISARLTGTPGIGTGAHQIHLAGSSLASPIACAECHVVPAAGDTSHATGVGTGGARATMTFGALARTGGLAAAYAGSTSASGGTTSGTCSNVYCHGASLGGGGVTTPTWTQTGPGPTACTACHGAPPPSPHPAGSDCNACHPGYSGSSVVAATHVDGHVDVVSQACGSCHLLPPALTGVLVPRADHTTPAHTSSADCGACHPGYTSSSVVNNTHANGQVEVTLSAASCTMCHGAPPLAPHPPIGDCNKCHPGYSSMTGTVVAATHNNGAVDVIPMTCTTCHGSGSPSVLANSAPPASVQGLTVITSLPVGAHQAHLAGVTNGGVRLSAPLACSNCHVVPNTATPDDVSHIGGGRGNVVLATGSYDYNGAANCSTYCHGSTLSGGINPLPAWNTTFTGASCNACHGFPPSTRGHVGLPSNDGTTCARCHHGTVDAAGAILVSGGTSLHVDGILQEDVSGGAGNCSKCHTTLAMGANATTYHHVMGALADGWSVYPSNPAPTSTSDKNCAQCHVDHDLFTAARGSNLRASISGTTPASSDTGVCTSCHTSTQAKDFSNQLDDGTRQTYAIDSAAYTAGGHSYAVTGSISGTGLDFQVSCTKCHNSTAATQFQDGTYQFGLHESTDRRLRGPLGRATVGDDVAEDFCYRCHSNVADNVGGTKKLADLSDWYGAATMPPGSTGIYTQMVGTPAVTTTTANTDTLYFKPIAQETPAAGPSSGSAETASAATNVLYLTSQAATGAPAGYLDAGVPFDTSVLRQNTMSLTADTVQTTVTGNTTSGITGYDKVAQFLSPPLAKAAAWASNVQFSIYLNRQEVATTNNCFVRYGVYKLSGGVATQIVTTTTSTSGESPTTAATSATNMSTSSAQTFAAGDQILVEISIAKSVPTATNTNACTVKWGATSTDQTRLTLPATTDSTFPEFTTATPLALNTTWAARSMSPFAPTAANEIITGTGTANAFQSMLWKRASFTSPPLGVAATLPSASWTLNVQDSRGGMSSSTSFLRYRIFRWNADGTQGPDIVAWRTYSTGMLSSLGLQAITVPATAVNATALAVGDRVVVEVEVETMNLTTSATGNNTIVFGSGNQSSVVMPAKVTFDYINTTQAAPATAGHLGGLYTGIHRPNPGEETLARIAAAKHVECSDCHDPHGAKRGNQADGGTATAGSATTLTDVNQSWLPGAWVGFYVDVVSGTGSGGRAQITGNTATQLTFTTLSTAPVAGSGYRVSMRANGGAVSSATSSTLTDTQNLVGGSTKAWQTNILAGWTVRIVLGTGVGQSAKVLSNTATQLTIVGTWATTPDTTSRYVVDRLPNVLTGAGGVNVTAWAAGTPSAWGEAKTIVPAPGSAVSIPDATTQWQVCFKCHSAANTAVTSWKSGWTDLASEFNPRNQSYHPIIAPAAAFAATGYGNTQLSATQLTNGWKPGDMMYCSDCHGNNDTGYGASQGPHASAVKFVLRGPNTRWPTMADNATRFTTGSSSPFTAGQGTASGLFCLNCHALSGVHTRSEHNNVACTGCHIVIPHGGKLKRLMRTSNTPSPYADVAGTVGQQVSADYPTGKAALKSYTGGVSDSSTSCGANCTTHHNLTPNTTTAPVNAW